MYFFYNENCLQSVILGVLLLCQRICCQIDDSADNRPAAVADQVGEYCQLETMRGRCRWKSEVIVMTSARWGRMKIGRCIDVHQNVLTLLGHDPLFLGCSENVMSIVDKKCSGRSECDIRIPDTDLDKVTPCYPDQKSYLEASYRCVKVVQESRSCLATVNNDHQFLSSSTSSADTSSVSSCGSRTHPWRIEAPVGQRINISLLDFGGPSAPRVHDTACRQYGYIAEKKNRRNVSICADNGTTKQHRESFLYTSDANSVDIVFEAQRKSDDYNFLVKVHAIGCTNMIPPDNAWLKRSNNDVIIGCYLSQQTWQLKCDGHEWKGQVGTCPDTYVISESKNDEFVTVNTQKDSKMYLVMIVIAGGAVIVCVTVVTTGIVCLQKCKRTYKKTAYPTTHEDAKFLNASNSRSGHTETVMQM